MRRKAISLLLAAVMVLSLSAYVTPIMASSNDFSFEVESEYDEHYTFSHYWNYDWWPLNPWGADATSAYLAEKFNVTVEFSRPDADADAKLNLMIASNDLPDCILMDRGSNNLKMAQLGLFVDLAPLMENNPNYNDGVLKQTQELLKIDGVLYGIPNWPRSEATGGNNAWIYNERIYEAAGRPEVKTFEDLYEYAKLIRDEVPLTEEGLPTFPFYFINENNDCFNVISGFNRSLGGFHLDGWFTNIGNDKYELAMRGDIYKQAVMEANKWYREGLLPATAITDTREQMIEKMATARTGLLYYDQSQDDNNHFRSIVAETYPGDTYTMFTDPVFPPAEGVDKVYGEVYGTIGWNVNCITTNAKDPQRIFDLWTYFYTKEGSTLMMYGPQGENWDEVDEDGNPLLKVAEQDMTSEEKDRLGMWMWNHVGHSYHVDSTKFAVNSALPEEKRSWVITNQSDYLTPTMTISDEFSIIRDGVDPLSDQGINWKLCEDYLRAQIPKVILAETAEEAEKLYDDIIKFVDNNGMPELEEIYDAVYQERLAVQDGTRYEHD